MRLGHRLQHRLQGVVSPRGFRRRPPRPRWLSWFLFSPSSASSSAGSFRALPAPPGEEDEVLRPPQCRVPTVTRRRGRALLRYKALAGFPARWSPQPAVGRLCRRWTCPRSVAMPPRSHGHLPGRGAGWRCGGGRTASTTRSFRGRGNGPFSLTAAAEVCQHSCPWRGQRCGGAAWVRATLVTSCVLPGPRGVGPDNRRSIPRTSDSGEPRSRARQHASLSP